MGPGKAQNTENQDLPRLDMMFYFANTTERKWKRTEKCALWRKVQCISVAAPLPLHRVRYITKFNFFQIGFANIILGLSKLTKNTDLIFTMITCDYS